MFNTAALFVLFIKCKFQLCQPKCWWQNSQRNRRKPSLIYIARFCYRQKNGIFSDVGLIGTTLLYIILNFEEHCCNIVLEIHFHEPSGRSTMSTEAWSEWPVLCKRHFQMDFCEWKLSYLNANLTRIPEDLGNGLSLNRRLPFTWSNFNQVPWHDMASLGHNSLTVSCTLYNISVASRRIWAYYLCVRVLANRSVLGTSTIIEWHYWEVVCKETVESTTSGTHFTNVD